MRLRLDKLVLSAGLALAMVATTIPVGAAVHTTTSDGETTVSVEDGFAKDVTTKVTDANFAKIVAPDADPVTKESTITITTAAATGTVNSDDKKVDVLKQSSFNDYLSQNGIDKDDVKAASDISYVVEQDVTYAITGYVYNLSATEKTEVAAEIEANTEETKRNAAKANALAAARKAAGLPEADSTSNPTVTRELGTATCTLEDGANPTKCTVTVTDKVTYTTAVTDLSSYSGYTYDLVLGTVAENEEPVVLKFDKSGHVSEITDGITVASDYKVAISLTDLTTSNIYVLATKTVSTSSNLLFGTDDADNSEATQKDTTNGESVVIKGEANPGTAAKTAIDTVVKNNSLTHVAYFDITAYNNADPTSDTAAVIPATTKTYTFKIAIPTDLPAVADGYTRTYKVIRYHGTDAEILDAEVADGYITFSSNLFSDYALAYVDVAAETTEATEEASNATDGTTVADATDATAAAATEAADSTADSSTTATKKSPDMGDNSMMPLFMTTLLLALCAGSLAIYKEKKTN